MTLSALKDHLFTAAATALLLGGGTTVLTTRINDTRQDVRIDTIEAALPEIQKNTRETREVVIRMEERAKRASQ